VPLRPSRGTTAHRNADEATAVQTHDVTVRRLLALEDRAALPNHKCVLQLNKLDVFLHSR
jgi:hypothetical protein